MSFKNLLNSKYFLISIIVLNIITIILTNQLILKDFPNSADEYVYFTMAETFSKGKLSVPSPLNKEFFDFTYIINDGKFYGKYPPGWPFFLALGFLIKIPMLINLIFTVLTLITIHSITKEISSKKTANIVLLITATSPYFILNSASYFSHPSSLFFATFAAYIYIKNLKSNYINFFLLGIVLGILFNIRPLDSISVLIPIFVFHIINKNSIKKEIKNLLLILSGFFILVSIFLLYNYMQTGNPFLTPFTKYNPDDKLGFGSYSELLWAMNNNILKRIIQLNTWIPLCFLFMIIALRKDKDKRKKLLLSIFLITLLAYFFYAFGPGDEYGPRYIYSASFTVYILTSIGLTKLNKKSFILTIFILIILNLVLLIYTLNLVNFNINQRAELYQTIKNNNITNAIIFSNYESSRNGINFNENVLYARNLNEKNILLINQYPNRRYYTWECDGIMFYQDEITKIWISKNINCNLNEIKLNKNI